MPTIEGGRAYHINHVALSLFDQMLEFQKRVKALKTTGWRDPDLLTELVPISRDLQVQLDFFREELHDYIERRATHGKRNKKAAV